MGGDFTREESWSMNMAVDSKPRKPYEVEHRDLYHALNKAQEEISRLQAENKRLNVCVKYWYESTVKLIYKAHEFEDQLRTAEQRVARECCEIVDKQETFSVQTATNCEMDGFVDKEETVAAIKAKYHLEKCEICGSVHRIDSSD